MATTYTFTEGLRTSCGKEDGALLTQMHPGTPMHDLFRKHRVPMTPVRRLSGSGNRLVDGDLVAFRTREAPHGRNLLLAPAGFCEGQLVRRRLGDFQCARAVEGEGYRTSRVRDGEMCRLRATLTIMPDEFGSLEGVRELVAVAVEVAGRAGTGRNPLVCPSIGQMFR